MTMEREVSLGGVRNAPEVVDWLREQKIAFRVHAGNDEHGKPTAKIKFNDDIAVMLWRLRSKNLID